MRRCQQVVQDVGGDVLQVVIQAADGACAVMSVMRGIGGVGDSQVTACQERDVVSCGLSEGDKFLFRVPSFFFWPVCRPLDSMCMVFMEAACGGCRVLSSSCLPWFSFDGSYRAIMVSECHLLLDLLRKYSSHCINQPRNQICP